MRTLLVALVACAGASPTDPPAGTADVIAVSVSGDPGAWTFAVSVRSPDTGCGQYADWWEVVSASEHLVYRRILTHPHETEQPFTRTGGPVALEADDEAVVRAHLSNGGYGGAMRGTPASGFAAWTAPAGWGAALASIEPQPDGCP